MSFEEDKSLSIEDVEKALTEIENKYSPIKYNEKDCFEDNLIVLSREFDSLGIPSIDCSLPISNVINNVVSGARSLVQIHRRTISQMKDVNINSRYKESKSSDLFRTIEDYRLKLTKCEEINSNLQKRIIKLTNDCSEVIKREHFLKQEIESTKRFYLSKQNESQRQIKKLTNENLKLKEMLGKDIDTSKSKSKDDIVLNLLKQYKGNEEIYKSTILKLEENNRHLLHEILDLQEEHALALTEQKS